jgi:hypothetical protein
MGVGQGSGSSERMGGYNLSIFLLCFFSLIVHVSTMYPCCFAYYPKYVLYVQSCCFCFYFTYVFVVRYMFCLLVSLVQSRCFICCCLYVSVVVQSHRFIYCCPYVSLFNMLYLVYCCYEIYVLFSCYASYIMLSYF